MKVFTISLSESGQGRKSLKGSTNEKYRRSSFKDSFEENVFFESLLDEKTKGKSQSLNNTLFVKFSAIFIIQGIRDIRNTLTMKNIGT